MNKDNKEHIYVSIDAKYVYENWHYFSLIFISDSGESETARHAHSISSLEQREEKGKAKVGKPVGFGPYSDEIVTGFKAGEAKYRRDPKGRRVKMKGAAPLIRHIYDGRPPDYCPTAEERASIMFVKQNEGAVFDLMHKDDAPMMSSEQFWITMPEHNAPGGYYIPKGLAELV